MTPQLQLTYSSATQDGSYRLTHKQGSWVGLGWDLSTGFIALNKRDGPETDYYSLVLNGQATDLVRGERLPGASFSLNHLQGWYFYSTDENFLKVRYQETGPHNAGSWLVWTKDGTRYEFATAAHWAFIGCSVVEPYKWLLSRIVDPNQNTISFQYDRLSQNRCGTTLTAVLWPTRISWGANLVTGAPDRYEVEFVSAPHRSDGSNAVAGAEDMEWDFADSQEGGQMAAPHETRKLLALKVRSLYAGPELVRQYNFSYDFSLYSDAPLCLSSSCPSESSGWDAHPAYRKLTLRSITRVGKDGTTALPPTRFNYYTMYDPANPASSERGGAKRANGGWNRLKSVDNGQGGTLSFQYDHIGQVYLSSGRGEYQANLFDNRHRATSQTVDDGRGNPTLTTYTYGEAAVNWLGAAIGDDRLPRPHPNAAPLYFSHADGFSEDLAVRKHTEFRGHAWMIERVHAGPDPSRPQLQKVAHYFDQGEGNPDGNPENGVGCTPQDDNEADSCFVSLRAHAFTKGSEWKTVWQTVDGAPLKATVQTFAVAAPLNAATIDYTAKPTRGLWWAFSFTSQTETRVYLKSPSFNNYFA